MILELYIKNFILIDETRLKFKEGLNIITGETGAGKSILLNALSLCFGGRWDKSYVRDSQYGTVVETTFYIESFRLRSQLSEIGADCADDGIFIISRELTEDGKSICRLNGRIVKLSQLKDVVKMVVDIHSQHASYSIFEKERHVFYLDHYAKEDIDDVKSEYIDRYKEYKKLTDGIKALTDEKDEKSEQREIDLIEFQLEEIEQAEIEGCDIDGMETEFEKLLNMKGIQKTVSSCYSKLYTSDFNVCDRISQVARELSEVSRFDGELERFRSEIEAVYHETVEISRGIREYSESEMLDEERLVQLEQRISAINNLKRKYGNTIEEIFKYREEISQKLDEIKNKDKRLKEMIVEKDKIEPILNELSFRLSGKRENAAEKFENVMQREVRALNNGYAQFKVNFDRKPEYDISGADDIEFMVSFNKGQDLLPIGKVASGGEISRFMLALKNVITEFESVETLIFDEIDTGISGITAQVVGEKLKEISIKKQIICITHLPQIAVNSDRHFSIVKSIKGERAQTDVIELSEEGKVNEIARLMGGLNVTRTTIESAKEILDIAKAD